MEKQITFKKQGNGQDSWIIRYLDDKGIDIKLPEIVYENPNNKEVELWRIKGVLTLMGRVNEVDAAIEQLPEPKRTLARFVWTGGNVLNSESDTVKFVQSVLGLTDEEKDSIFEQAEAIKL